MKKTAITLLSGWCLALAVAALSPQLANADACPGDKRPPSLLCPDEKKKPSLVCPGDKKPPSACPGDKKKPSQS